MTARADAIELTASCMCCGGPVPLERYAICGWCRRHLRVIFTGYGGLTTEEPTVVCASHSRRLLDQLRTST